MPGMCRGNGTMKLACIEGGGKDTVWELGLLEWQTPSTT